MRRLPGTATGESYLAVDTEAGLLDLQLMPANDTTREVVMALAPLAHPNLARLRDAGLADGDLYLVQDHIEGVSLADLSRHGPLPGDVTLHIIAALSSALAEAENIVQTQPTLTLRVPSLDEVLVSSVGQVKMPLTSVITLPSSAETVIDIEESMAAAAVAQSAGRRLIARSQSPGPTALLGQMIDRLLGPVRPGEGGATQAARELAEVVQKGHGSPGDCRALHGLAVTALRQSLTSPTGGFVFRKLSDLVEHYAPRSGGEEADVAAAGALLLAALPEGTPQVRRVQSWCYDFDPAGRMPGRHSAASPPAGAHVLGQQLAGTPYKLLRKLGIGGMGIVFEAEHIDLNRRVALKLLHGNLNRDPQVLARFRQEARSAARIRHPHVVEIYEFGTTSAGEVFLVMELLEGQSLTRLCRGPALPFERSVTMLWQVCDAVEAAHQAGVIHRDLKPDNVMIVPQKRPSGPSSPDWVKVLDFGIAKLRDPGFGAREPGQTITRQGQLFGTPEYMAPEQILGGRSDHRVDIYALGCIAYELLTGTLPFSGENYGEMLAAHIKDQPMPLQERAPARHIPYALSDAVLRAMAKDPQHRFGTMAEFGAALLAALPGLDPVASSRTPPFGIPAPYPVPIPGSGAISAGVVAVAPQASQPAATAPVRRQLRDAGYHRSPWQNKLIWCAAGAMLGLAAFCVWIWQQPPPRLAHRSLAEGPEGAAATANERPPGWFGPLRPPLEDLVVRGITPLPHQPTPPATAPPAEAPTVPAPRLPAPMPSAPVVTAPAHQQEPTKTASNVVPVKPEPSRPTGEPVPAHDPDGEEPAQATPPTASAPPAPAEPAPTEPAPQSPTTRPPPKATPEHAPAAPIARPAPRMPPPLPWLEPKSPEPRFSSGKLSLQVENTTSAYNRRDVLTGLDAQRRMMDACYEQAVKRNPANPSRGSGTLTFAINEDGVVMTGRSTASGAVTTIQPCLEQALSRSRFARPEIGPAFITLRLSLDPIL